MSHSVLVEQSPHLEPGPADDRWAEAHTLLVADAHFGKAASFEAVGIDVGDGSQIVGPLSMRRDVIAPPAV